MVSTSTVPYDLVGEIAGFGLTLIYHKHPDFEPVKHIF